MNEGASFLLKISLSEKEKTKKNSLTHLSQLRRKMK
jgi:hypothetical protein